MSALCPAHRHRDQAVPARADGRVLRARVPADPAGHPRQRSRRSGSPTRPSAACGSSTCTCRSSSRWASPCSALQRPAAAARHLPGEGRAAPAARPPRSSRRSLLGAQLLMSHDRCRVVDDAGRARRRPARVRRARCPRSCRPSCWASCSARAGDVRDRAAHRRAGAERQGAPARSGRCCSSRSMFFAGLWMPRDGDARRAAADRRLHPAGRRRAVVAGRRRPVTGRSRCTWLSCWWWTIVAGGLAAQVLPLGVRSVSIEAELRARVRPLGAQGDRGRCRCLAVRPAGGSHPGHGAAAALASCRRPPSRRSLGLAGRGHRGWMLWFFTLHPQWHGTPPADGRVLHRADGADRRPGACSRRWYGFFAFVGYLHAFQCLTRPVALRRRRRHGGDLGGRRTSVASTGIDGRRGGRWLAVSAGQHRLLATRGLLLRRAWPSSATAGRSRRSSSWTRPTPSWRRRWRRTPACTPSCWSRPARPGCSTSGSGWRGRSTTPWPRG